MEGMETEAKATMEEVVANMDNQPKFKKGQLITATISVGGRFGNCGVASPREEGSNARQGRSGLRGL